jgi:hypothetical protein
LDTALTTNSQENTSYEAMQAAAINAMKLLNIIRLKADWKNSTVALCSGFNRTMSRDVYLNILRIFSTMRLAENEIAMMDLSSLMCLLENEGIARGFIGGDDIDQAQEPALHARRQVASSESRTSRSEDPLIIEPRSRRNI